MINAHQITEKYFYFYLKNKIVGFNLVINQIPQSIINHVFLIAHLHEYLPMNK